MFGSYGKGLIGIKPRAGESGKGQNWCSRSPYFSCEVEPVILAESAKEPRDVIAALGKSGLIHG